MRRSITRIATGAVLILATAIFAFPLYYLVATSFKTRAELFAAVPTLFPKVPSLQPYEDVLVNKGMTTLLVNSIIAGVCATALALVVAYAICYPITRLPVSRSARSSMKWMVTPRVTKAISRKRWHSVSNLKSRSPLKISVSNLNVVLVPVSSSGALPISLTGAAAAAQFPLLPPANASGNFTKVTQRVPVRISVEQREGGLRPGMMVEVRIATGK